MVMGSPGASRCPVHILATWVSQHPTTGVERVLPQAGPRPEHLRTHTVGSELSPPFFPRHLPFPLAVAPGAREHAGGRGVLVWECEPAL